MRMNANMLHRHEVWVCPSSEEAVGEAEFYCLIKNDKSEVVSKDGTMRIQ